MLQKPSLHYVPNPSPQLLYAPSILSTSKRTKSRYSPSKTVAYSPTGASSSVPFAALVLLDTGETILKCSVSADASLVACLGSGCRVERG